MYFPRQRACAAERSFGASCLVVARARARGGARPFSRARAKGRLGRASREARRQGARPPKARRRCDAVREGGFRGVGRGASSACGLAANHTSKGG